jgi:hypothetical protein
MELILASGTPENFKLLWKSCLSTDLAPVMKMTWSTFQLCRWITALMALRREAIITVNHTGEGSEIDQIPPVIHFPEMLHGEHAEIIDD